MSGINLPDRSIPAIIIPFMLAWLGQRIPQYRVYLYTLIKNSITGLVLLSPERVLYCFNAILKTEKKIPCSQRLNW